MKEIGRAKKAKECGFTIINIKLIFSKTIAIIEI